MWPVKLGLASVEREKRASSGCCYLMMALVSVYTSADVLCWYIETDHLISTVSALSTSSTKLSGYSTMNEKCIIIVFIHNVMLVQPEKPQQWLQPIKLKEGSPENIWEWMGSCFAVYHQIQKHNCSVILLSVIIRS